MWYMTSNKSAKTDNDKRFITIETNKSYEVYLHTTPHNTHKLGTFRLEEDAIACMKHYINTVNTTDDRLLRYINVLNEMAISVDTVLPPIAELFRNIAKKVDKTLLYR